MSAPAAAAAEDLDLDASRDPDDYIALDVACSRCGAFHLPEEDCGLSEDEDATYTAFEALPDDPAERLHAARHILAHSDHYDPALVHAAQVAAADLDEGPQPGLRIPTAGADALADQAAEAVAKVRAGDPLCVPPASDGDPATAEADLPRPYYGWDGEHDPAGETHATPCPKCDAAAGEPCRIPSGDEYLYRDGPWHEGWVHPGRAVRHAHNVWLAALMAEHHPAAIREPCLFPGCGTAAGADCEHMDARLALALARAKEPRAASEVARTFLDNRWPWGESVCPTCHSKASDGCRTRSGKHCMDHDEKLEPWHAQRAWLEAGIDAIEASIYSCTECLDGHRYPHATCERIAQTNAEIRERIARGEAKDHDLIGGPLEYRSPEAQTARMAANPALAIACPECWAHVGQECRQNADGNYVTCRQRRAVHERAATPTMDLFPGAAPVMAPPKTRRAR